MEILDRIMGMQQKGTLDTEISRQLQNEGVAPSQISDSLNQAKIKNAVSPPAPEDPNQGMQASIMSEPGPAPAAPGSPEVYPSEQMPLEPQAAPQMPAAQDDYYQQTPQAYSDQDYYAPQGGTDTETISEIAEQVVTEKLNEYKTKVGDVVSFKSTTLDKIEDIDDRLKRIEGTIDKLQQAIIGKIGEFGESNAMIHKDLDNLHGTVSKLMNPLVDNYNEMKKVSKKA